MQSDLEFVPTTYDAFLASKRRQALPAGFDGQTVDWVALPTGLFAWQADIVRWALRRGRACLFEDCGLGKSIQYLAWSRAVADLTGQPVLVATPLAVAEQSAREAAKFGIDGVLVSRDGTIPAGPSIVVTNYERLHLFDFGEFAGFVADESSILKSHDGKTRTAIIERSRVVPYRLACTATPAPNDVIELCNHAEFVGASTRAEMLATWFVHDGGSTQDWRLKGHAVADFWRWVATWAVMVRSPADIGYPADAYVLPSLDVQEHIVESGIVTEGQLFVAPAATLSDQRQARRHTLSARVAEVAEMVNATPGQWLVWCELNDEGDALVDAIPGAVQVAGRDPDDIKAEVMLGFTSGEVRVLVTKPSIAGFGMNWQQCHQMAFVGLSHSWEQFYQAIRRCWRFGQLHPVTVHIISSDAEVVVLQNIKAKQAAADSMADAMVRHMADAMRGEIRGTVKSEVTYQTEVTEGDGWTVHLGDCVDVVRTIEDESIDYSIFSPPFASLYTYSASDRDMGNCVGESDFLAHYGFLLTELFRVLRPGRLMSFHCMDLPTSKAMHGYIGLIDFRGHLIAAAERAGFIYHSGVTIWKDPVTAMQRTKALGLLHKQIRKDSSMSRQGVPDYLITMRKPGENEDPIAHDAEGFPVAMWQRYASPVWMDINPTDTLQHRSAREHEDERHICPLQLGVIRRAMALWTNPGDLVLSPFTGIGSEGHVAIEMRRRFVGAELKGSYYRQAVANLQAASTHGQEDLFAHFGMVTDPDEAHLLAAVSTGRAR